MKINSVRNISPKAQKIILLSLDQLWKRQFDTLTEQRVLQAFAEMSLPMEWYQNLEENIVDFVDEGLSAGLSSQIDISGGIIASSFAEFSWSANTQDMLNYIQNEGAKLAVDMGKFMRTNVNTILNEAVNSSWSIGQASESMRGAITLTQKENQAALNYVKKLKGQGLTDRQVKLLQKQYRSKLLNARSRRIAKTELTRAKHIGEMGSINKAIKEGKITAAKKTWRKTNDVDNWDSSNMYDGESVDINSDFSEIGIPGITTMPDFSYPSEINEGCILEYDGVGN